MEKLKNSQIKKTSFKDKNDKKDEKSEMIPSKEKNEDLDKTKITEDTNATSNPPFSVKDHMNIPEFNAHFTDDEETFETSDNELIKDFINQTQIIDIISETFYKKPEGTSKVSEKSKIKKKDKNIEKKIFEFDNPKFDKSFYNDLQSKSLKINDASYLDKGKKECFVNFIKSPNLQIDNKWNFKMISLCKSLHFFDMKRTLIPCKYCKKMFTNHGMGGHMSRKHPKLSDQFNKREEVKRLRKCHRERNEFFKCKA